MRRIMIVLALSILSFSPNTSQAKQQTAYSGHFNNTTLTFYQESDDQEICQLPGGSAWLELRQSQADSLQTILGYQVMLVTVVVTNDKSSQRLAQLTNQNFFGYEHHGRQVFALGVTRQLLVPAGKSDRTFFVFRRQPVNTTDHFFVLSGTLGE